VLKKAALELRSCPTAILAKSGLRSKRTSSHLSACACNLISGADIHNWAIYNKILYYQEMIDENAILAIIRSPEIKHVISPIT
jgi:hypothetical protein